MTSDFFQLSLSDNAANTNVIGNLIDGTLVGGNTEDVASIVNGSPAFHLNGSTQYVVADFLHIQPSANHIEPSETGDLWTKYAGNPVLSDPGHTIAFGQLVYKPGGGWYFFGAYDLDAICRWESTDLITWTNKTTALASGGVGAWDEDCQVATVFQKPSDDTWVMLYRGYIATEGYQIGLATSVDGTTFDRKNNGGVDDGLFPQFDDNYDPVGVILVGTTYYVYVNGDPSHGTQNVYYSTDDCATFTAYSRNPIFTRGGAALSDGSFCPGVFAYDGYYYLLLCRDLNSAGSTLYDHGIALYRCEDPFFDQSNRQYLGYVAVNDQAYDARYMDTPSVPMTDVYKTTYAPEFGDTLYMLYTSIFNTQSLAYTTFAELAARQPIRELALIPDLEYNTYSFHVQFDSLANMDEVFSIGVTPGAETARWLGVIRTSGADLVLGLYLGGAYSLTTLALAIDTPYHMVIVEGPANKKVYINHNLVGTFTEANNHTCAGSYLYIGTGYDGTQPLDGYVWDFRIYPNSIGHPRDEVKQMSKGRIPIITNYASTDLVHIKVNPYGGDPSSRATPVSNFFGNIPDNVDIGVGTGAAAPLGRFHVNQPVGDAGKPVVVLSQTDLSEGFTDYLGTSAASAVGPISSWTTGNTIQGFVRTEINGAAYWMPYYDAPTS